MGHRPRVPLTTQLAHHRSLKSVYQMMVFREVLSLVKSSEFPQKYCTHSNQTQNINTLHWKTDLTLFG